MENKRLILAIVLVTLLIIGIIVGFLYMQNNNKQASTLQNEISLVLEKDILKDKIDMKIKSTGNYGIVEKTVKDYISNIKELYDNSQKFCNDDEISNILSAENIEADEEELSVVTQKVSECKSKLDEIKTNTTNITNKVNILDAIDETSVKQNYIDIYKNIMENDALQSKLTNAQKIIEEENEKAEKRITGLENVITFLIENSKYWKIDDGKLQFTNINKLTQYYQILNGDE